MCVLVIYLYIAYLHIYRKLAKQIKKEKICNTKLKLRKFTYAFPMPHQCKKRKKDKYLPRIYLPFVGFLTQTTAADFLHNIHINLENHKRRCKIVVEVDYVHVFC